MDIGCLPPADAVGPAVPTGNGGICRVLNPYSSRDVARTALTRSPTIAIAETSTVHVDWISTAATDDEARDSLLHAWRLHADEFHVHHGVGVIGTAGRNVHAFTTPPRPRPDGGAAALSVLGAHTMLTGTQRQAIVDCLRGLSTNALDHEYPLLAALIQTPVLDHRDPTAQFLGVRPLPVPEEFWAHPDGVVAGLRQAAADLRNPAVRAQLAAAPRDLHLLAWVFMHIDLVTDYGIGPVAVRVIEAVDIDDLAYLHTRPPGGPAGSLTVRTADPDDSDTIVILRELALSLRTD